MIKLLQLFLLIPVFASAQYTGLQFDGAGDYIVTSYNGVAGSGSRTVQFWFKGFSSSLQRFMVDMGNLSGGNGARFSVKINPSANVARVEIGGAGLDGTVNIANNFWHQVTVVYDNAASSNKYMIYIDGTLNVQGDLAIALNTPATSTNPVTLGIRNDLNSTTTLAGGLDDVRIWSGALTPAQIIANYNTELCGIPTGLAAYFKINEGVAVSNNTAITSLINVVSPASVNTLYGFTLTGNSSNYITNILAIVNNTSSQTLTKCDSYFWVKTGLTYTNSGTYTATVPLYTGCDSVYTLNLTIITNPGSSTSVSSCTNYTWPQTGQTYSTSGAYSQTLTTAGGCDSIVTLNLTITPIAPTTIPFTSCTNYLWPQTGLTYTASGLYSDTLTTAAGCDSIVKLSLTINQPSAATVTANSCTSYLWALNGTTYSNSGTYSHTIQNAAGCDSVVTLVLTINSVSSTTQTANTCSSYLWTANNQTYTNSGTYTHTLTTAAGCDSIIQLTLTLLSQSNTVTNNGDGTLTADISGATYQWINCADNSFVNGATNQTFGPIANGSYAVITTSSTCTDTSACVAISNVGIEDLNQSSFNVFPNPSNGKFTVENAEGIVIQSISIRDIQGKEVQSFSPGLKSFSIDLTAYDSGLYYLMVVAENGQKLNYRLVKQ